MSIVRIGELRLVHSHVWAFIHASLSRVPWAFLFLLGSTVNNVYRSQAKRPGQSRSVALGLNSHLR